MAKRRGHAGLEALRDEVKERRKSGEISFGDAVKVRVMLRLAPGNVIEALEEAKAAANDEPNAPATAGEWTPEEWAAFIKEIFQMFMENLPQLLALCAAV